MQDRAGLYISIGHSAGLNLHAEEQLWHRVQALQLRFSAGRHRGTAAEVHVVEAYAVLLLY